ncbi:MAG: hypothetical protein FWG74_01670 [Planctomycetes bacterium]|nr:hypothetical protein [Planctomycetota bacterium]
MSKGFAMLSIDRLPAGVALRLLAASDRVQNAERARDAARVATEHPNATWRDADAYWSAEAALEKAGRQWRAADRAARKVLPAACRG